MADPADMSALVNQLMDEMSPEEHQALLAALLSGQTSRVFEELARDQEPELLPVTEVVRGFQVRLDLHGAKPPVWRRLELPGDLRLNRLHDVIQAAMGWQDYHLHRFRTGRDHRSPYFVTPFDMDEGDDGVLEDDVRLDQLVAAKGDELWYEYDFGDGWDHRIAVEQVLDEPPERVACTAGRMAGPPEDCGGIGGYDEIAAWVRSDYDQALLPPVFESADSARDWLPQGWHPDDFSLDEVNEQLRTAVAEPVAVVTELAELMVQVERSGIRLLREVLARPDSFGSTDVSDADAERLTETYRTFLEIIGDGVDLTAAGFLRPVVVEQIATRTGIAEWWLGRANREDATPPVADIRSTARAMGLVSVRKGRLSPTAAARRCQGDAQQLLRHIVGRLPLGSSDLEREAGWMALVSAGSGTPAEQRREEVSELLYGLGWRSGHDGFSPPPSRSETLVVLGLLAGAARSRWGQPSGVDDAVAAVTRSAIRTPETESPR